LPEAGVLPGVTKSEQAPSPLRREIGTVGDEDETPDVLPLRRQTSGAGEPAPGEFDSLPPEELSRQFSRLWTLPASSLALLCERASAKGLLTAMAGAEPEDAERFLALFPKGESKAFRDRLSQALPLSLAQIERAQQELLVLAGSLADDDLI
jgi:hypothetical protein